MDGQQKIAVIGSGVAGITAAYLLSRKHHVTLFESDTRLGGHTSTVVIPDGPDAGTAVDTGFIVLNNRTYPLLHELFRQWGVEVRSAEMSFGYFDEASGLMYGSRDLNMVLASRSNLVKYDFWSMTFGIARFWRELPKALAAGDLYGVSLRDYIATDYSTSFVEHYLIPFCAAIWSASGEEVLEMPAELCARFFLNHGMLSYRNNPQWQTVIGGSHTYVQAFQKLFTGAIRVGDGVVSIKRSELGVDIRSVSGPETSFDNVIVAVHADHALGLLSDPSEEEMQLLGAWRYSKNRTVLHTDSSFLPPHKRGVAAWNYCRFRSEVDLSTNIDERPVCLTYHMNTLQGLTTKRQYCVTLNPRRQISEDHIVREFDYAHPIFDEISCSTQQSLHTLNGKNRTWFCGSYFGWGFHEDAVRSSVSLARDFGVEL